MDRDRLTSLIHDPAHVAAGDLAALQKLTARYPWFAGAHFLHAAGVHAGGGVLADEALRTAAAHIPRRAALYDAVHPAPNGQVRTPEPAAIPPTQERPAGETQPGPTAPMDPPTAEPGARTPPADPDPDTPRVVVVDAVPQAPEAPQEMPEAVAAPPGEAPLSEEPELAQPVDIVAPAAPPGPDPEDVTAAPPADDELDRLVRQAAFAQGYEFLMEHALPPVAPVSSAPEPPARPVDPPAPPPPMPIRGRMRFTDWISAPPTGPVEPIPEPVIKEGPAADMPTTPPPPTDPVDVSALIDRFIEQSAPPPPPRAGFFKPQVVAKQSLDDTAGLVTETLARIHEQQGNYAKAIETYRRLALKYPDKSAYFAGLSKALEARLNK